MKRVLDRGWEDPRTKHKAEHAQVDENHQPKVVAQNLEQEQREWARLQAEQHNKMLSPEQRQAQELRLQQQEQHRIRQHKLHTQVRYQTWCCILALFAACNTTHKRTSRHKQTTGHDQTNVDTGFQRHCAAFKRQKIESFFFVDLELNEWK